MLTLDALAEERIREAQSRGEFDDLPGAGAPLELGDDALVPEDLRAAYRILRNSGFLPPEVEALREVREIEALLRAAVVDDSERVRLLARVSFLLERAGGARGCLRIDEGYLERVAARLADRRKA